MKAWKSASFRHKCIKMLMVTLFVRSGQARKKRGSSSLHPSPPPKHTVLGSEHLDGSLFVSMRSSFIPRAGTVDHQRSRRRRSAIILTVRLPPFPSFFSIGVRHPVQHALVQQRPFTLLRGLLLQQTHWTFFREEPIRSRRGKKC